MCNPNSFQVVPDATDPDNIVTIIDPRGTHWVIGKESADPEHRFTAYRIAAGYFGNLPAGFIPGETGHD